MQRKTTLGVLAALALLLETVGVGVAAAPRIGVDSPTWAFPDTVAGIAVTHAFVLSNAGEQELVITTVAPGCHCTTTLLAASHLQPGQSVELRAMLDTEGLSGRVVRYITITSSDPVHPQITVSLMGNVVARQAFQTSVARLFADSYLLLDVRESTDYAAGHILGAMNVPESQIAAYVGQFPRGVLTVFYDQVGSLPTRVAVSQALVGGGLADVYAMRGGFDAWRTTYPLFLMRGVENGWGRFLDVPAGGSYASGPVTRTIDVKRFGSSYHILLDVRAPSAFSAGHLAGALNVSEAEAGDLAKSLPLDVEVIVYSDDGSASDRVISAAWAQGSRAKSLLGGLAEWQKQHGNLLVVASSD